jgi:hypothetical protein
MTHKIGGVFMALGATAILIGAVWHLDQSIIVGTAWFSMGMGYFLGAYTEQWERRKADAVK